MNKHQWKSKRPKAKKSQWKYKEKTKDSSDSQVLPNYHLYTLL
jgi:hypothetical protein